MKFDSKCHLSTKLFAEHSKIASQPINWKVNKCHFVVLVVNKCHFVVLVVNKCHFVVLVVNKCHFVVLVVNKCHFVVLVVRKRSRNDFTLLKRVLKLCNNVANYGTNVFNYFDRIKSIIIQDWQLSGSRQSLRISSLPMGPLARGTLMLNKRIKTDNPSDFLSVPLYFAK